MKKSATLRALTATLLLTISLSSLAGCQSPSEGTPDTDGATVVEGTTAGVTEEETTAEEITEVTTAEDTSAEETTVAETDTEEVTTEAEETTAAPDRELTVDGRYRIVISASADTLTRETADRVAELFLEKAGLELAIVTDAEEPAPHELVLGYTNRTEYDPVDDYSMYVNGDSIHLEASGGATLYAAAEEVLDNWLTADFGLIREGEVSLWESRLADLNGLTHELSGSIKVMTLNLRDADDANGNTIPKRFERLFRLLGDYRPDIIGTQEHSFNWDVRLEKQFNKMTGEEDYPLYNMVGYFTEGQNTRGGGRNAIWYRVDRFDLIETDTFWLSETPHSTSTMTGTTFKRVCTWALLKDKRTDKTFMAANIHLDHESEITRLAQIQVALNILEDKAGDYPVFFVGDFNASSRDDAYAAVAEKYVDARDTARNLSTVSGTFHGYHPGGWGSPIDHIFYNDKSTPVTYEILSKDYDGFVSDHYPVMVEFVID